MRVKVWEEENQILVPVDSIAETRTKKFVELPNQSIPEQSHSQAHTEQAVQTSQPSSSKTSPSAEIPFQLKVEQSTNILSVEVLMTPTPQKYVAITSPPIMKISLTNVD